MAASCGLSDHVAVHSVPLPHSKPLPPKKRVLYMMTKAMENSTNTQPPPDLPFTDATIQETKHLTGEPSNTDEKIAALALVAAAAGVTSPIISNPDVLPFSAQSNVNDAISRTNAPSASAQCASTTSGTTNQLPEGAYPLHLGMEHLQLDKEKNSEHARQDVPSTQNTGDTHSAPIYSGCVLPSKQSDEESDVQCQDRTPEGGKLSSSSATHQKQRIIHPPLATPLPGGCHGRTSRNNSFCRRIPCYNGSKYCKLHYQQYVLAAGLAKGLTGAEETLRASGSPSEREKETRSKDGSHTHANSAPQRIPNHQQDKRYTGFSLHEQQCMATTTRGRPCAYVSVNGTKYCHLHADYDTNPPPRRGGGSTHSSKQANQPRRIDAKFSLNIDKSRTFHPHNPSSLSGDPQSRSTSEENASKVINAEDVSGHATILSPHAGYDSLAKASNTSSRPPLLSSNNDSADCRVPFASKSELATDQTQTSVELRDKEPSKLLLSTIPSDQWADKLVLIMTGPLVNHLGRVMKWGNGWVTVRINAGGSLDLDNCLLHNRRAMELCLLPSSEGQSKLVTACAESWTRDQTCPDPSVQNRSSGEMCRGRASSERILPSQECYTMVEDGASGTVLSEENLNDDRNPSKDISSVSAESCMLTENCVPRQETRPSNNDLPCIETDANFESIEPPAEHTNHQETSGSDEPKSCHHSALEINDIDSTTACPTQNREEPGARGDDMNSLRLIESVARIQEGRGGRRHNLDLLFGTAAMERSRRTIHKPERYEDKAMLEKKRRSASESDGEKDEAERLSLYSPAKKWRTDCERQKNVSKKILTQEKQRNACRK